MKKVSIIHGPNLNMLGTREKEYYGDFTLDELNDHIIEQKENCELSFYQNNSEGEIVTYIQSCKENKIDAIVINAGAYTHTSIAIRDALLSAEIPFIEVHISNVYSREPFRRESYLSDIAIGVISGFGKESYTMAVKYFNSYFNTK